MPSSRFVERHNRCASSWLALALARLLGRAVGNLMFTQEDPLGLAEGLNAYGFASGDPA